MVRFLFYHAGYMYDDETGLYYLNARMYDPKIARFLQEDTYRGSVNDPLSLNLYTYCHNEPIMYWDPTGHKLTSWDISHVTDKNDKNAITSYSNKWQSLKNQQDSLDENDAHYENKYGRLQEQMNEQHDLAEGIRGKYRSENDVGDSYGYTHKVSANSSNSNSSSSGGTLDYGSRGDSVAQLQQALESKGYFTLPAGASYGYFGDVTLDAVNRFKDDNRLWNFGDYYGKVGDTTWGYLFNSKPSNTVSVSNQGTSNLIPADEPGTIVYDPLGNIIDSAADRSAKNGDSLYDSANYWSFGFMDSVKGAVQPEKPFSLQHWIDSAVVATTVFPAIDGTFGSFESSASKGAAKSTLTQEEIDAANAVDLRMQAQRGIGGKGWRGDSTWRANIKTIGGGGTIESVNGTIPTQQEAIDLINASGGKIERIEGAHPEGGISNHTYPHINYTTPSGEKGAIRIQEVIK